MLQRLTMWGFLVLVLALGSVGAVAEPRVMGRLFWCNTLCMCETETNREVKCFHEDDVYQLLGYTSKMVSRVRSANYSLESNVYWCEDLCLCHNATGKNFRCTQALTLIQLILDKIGNTYFLEPERNRDIKQEEERSIDQEEERSIDQEKEEAAAAVQDQEGHRKRSDRKKNKKNRNQKKNKRTKHRHHSEEPDTEPVLEPAPQQQPEPASEPEPQPETTPKLEPDPKVNEYTPSKTQRTTPSTDTPSVYGHKGIHGFQEGEVEEVEATEEPEPLPKQEAVAASPAVTALQPPTRQIQPFSTAEAFTPRASAREVEPMSPRLQPVVEVPKEKKTVASMVSQDLDDLDSTVRDIKNDVMLNQRILLVTAAVAGMAMLGVLILAILGCTKRRQNQATDMGKKRDGSKDGNRSPKVNLEEAW